MRGRGKDPMAPHQASPSDREIPKKKRAFKPKVKTGCLTCRKRRIKCDEAKPVCLRCKKGGFDCDGYTSILTTSNNQIVPLISKRAILPKPPLPQIVDKSEINYGAECLFQPPTLAFSSEQEYRYYRVFCEKMAYQLAGHHEFPLWNYLILQAAEQESSIRHAVIAVGALEKTRQASNILGFDVASLECGLMDEHHVFAIKQYSLAIREMREAITNRKHNLRTTLLTCLLIICFESFHGNHESALTQIQAGLRLLEEWVGSKTREPDFKKDQSLNLSLQSINSYSSTEAQSSLTTSHTLFDIVSPAPDTIEDEILHAFARLDMQALAFLDHRPIEYHRLMKSCGSARLSRMPLHFNNLTESRGYYELIIRRLMHWISAAGDFRRNLATEVKSKMEEIGGMGGGGILNRCQPQSERIDPEGVREQQKHLDEMDEWHERFLPVYRDLCSKPFSRDWLAATGMELKWVCSRMALSAALGSDMMIYDQYLEDFKKIIDLVKVLLSYPETLVTFAFDLAMIPQLYVVAIKCRDPQVRREAIWLLLSNPRREGVWDSLLAGKMASAVMEIEEAEMVDGFIPSWARVRGTKMNFNLLKREGTLIALMSQTEPGGDVKVVKRIVSW